MSERDIEAIASWQRHDTPPSGGGSGVPHVCIECDWTGRGGIKAYAHHRVTGHAVRGKHWPASWGNSVFSDKETR